MQRLGKANKLIGIFMCFIFPFASLAQDAPVVENEIKTPVVNKKRDYQFMVRASAGIPSATSNRAFRKVFNGTIDVSTQVTYNIFRGFFVGVGGKYLLFKVTSAKVPLINTEYHLANFSGVLGYEYQFSDNKVLSVSLSAGNNWIKYKKIIPYEGQTVFYARDNFTGYNIEGTVGYYFYAEENFAIGGNLGYNVIYNTFNPNNIYLNKNNKSVEFDKRDYKGYTQYFALGFGIYYGIGQKKKV